MIGIKAARNLTSEEAYHTASSDTPISTYDRRAVLPLFRHAVRPLLHHAARPTLRHSARSRRIHHHIGCRGIRIKRHPQPGGRKTALLGSKCLKTATWLTFTLNRSGFLPRFARRATH